MIEVAEAWVWAIVGAGGVLALLSLILAVSLWVMMGSRDTPADKTETAGKALPDRASTTI